MNKDDDALINWRPPPPPPFAAMRGRYAVLEALSPAHAEELHQAKLQDGDGSNWRYLPYGPFAALADYRRWLESVCRRSDPMFFAVRDESGAAVGIASYLRIKPDAGTIEVGHIHFSPLLQRRRAATEAMYLMMKNAFNLGYRRYEWKCNAQNLASRRAAQRLGMSYEGVFRQHLVVKDRNRDTAWFSLLDREWDGVCAQFNAWLHPDNFDDDGRQRQSLSQLTLPLVATPDPLL